MFSIPERDVGKLIDFSMDNEFESIELWDTPLEESNHICLERIRLTGLHVSVHAPLLSPGDVKSVKMNVKLLKESICRAKTWGAKILVLHTGLVPPGTDLNSALKATKAVIQQNLHLLEQHEIMLCLENTGYLGNEIISNFVQLAELTDTFPNHLVGVTFDLSHAEITDGVSKGLDILGNRITHIHISDGIEQSNVHHLPLGKGTIEFSVLKNRIVLQSWRLLPIITGRETY